MTISLSLLRHEVIIHDPWISAKTAALKMHAHNVAYPLHCYNLDTPDLTIMMSYLNVTRCCFCNGGTCLLDTARRAKGLCCRALSSK